MEETYDTEGYEIGGGYESSRTVMIADDSVEQRIGESEALLGNVQQSIDELDGLIEDVNVALENLVNVLTWKGTVETVGMLPDDAEVGDVYHVDSDSAEWAWDGTQWQELGVTVNMANYYDIDDVDALLALKANVAHTHTKSQITDLVEGDGAYYRVANKNDTTSISGKTLTYPCMAFVTSTEELYDIDEEGW